MGSATSNEAKRDAAHRVDHHSTQSSAPFGPNEISVFFPRMLQAECNFETIYEC